MRERQAPLFCAGWRDCPGWLRGPDLVSAFFYSLYWAADRRRAIEAVLEVTVHYLGTRHAYIYLAGPDDGVLHKAFEYRRPLEPSFPSKGKPYTLEHLQRLLALCDDTGLFCCGDRRRLPRPLCTGLKRAGICHILQVPVLGGQGCRGVVGFCGGAPKQWNGQQVQTAFQVAKVIGIYLPLGGEGQLAAAPGGACPSRAAASGRAESI